MVKFLIFREKLIQISGYKGPYKQQKWAILGGAISNTIFFRKFGEKVYLVYHFFKNFQNSPIGIMILFQIIFFCLIFTK